MQPVDSQVAISLSNPRQKVQKKQQSSRLLALKTAFDKEEDVTNDDDDDDEWDPLQVQPTYKPIHGTELLPTLFAVAV